MKPNYVKSLFSDHSWTVSSFGYLQTGGAGRSNFPRKSMNSYTASLELYSCPTPDAFDAAKKVVNRMEITEIEGILTHIFNNIPADRKLEIRTAVVAQHNKFQQVEGGRDLIQAQWVTKMKNALIFK